MTGDELNDPLGVRATGGPSPRSAPPYRLIAIGGLGVACLLLFAFLRLTGDPMGGEPYAIAAIGPRASLPAPSPPSSETAKASTDTTGTIGSERGTPDKGSAAQELELKSGVKIFRPPGSLPSGALIIDVPQALGLRLPPAPDMRLVEKGRYGLLPKVGKDGARAAEVYARPVIGPSVLQAGAPRIAIILGGLGLSTIASDAALATLPGAVTFAYAPYGTSLPGDVERARDKGHEVLLQVPMETFDMEQASPGPHVLRSSATAADNLDQLHWSMSRFSGYAGVMNFLGAKFTADDGAFTPILRELAARGVFYLDDGSSARSAAALIAPSLALPSARVDVMLDAVARSDAIDAALARLEALARDKGVAIGMASALPLSIERIAKFTATIEAHGILLVPASAIVAKSHPALVNREQ